MPGRVKTRLQPAFTPSEAARLAAASLEDTLATVRSCRAGRRILAWEGDPSVVARFLRGDWSAAGNTQPRLSAAFAAALADPADEPALLIGMDTPQVTASCSTWIGREPMPF